MLRFVMRDNFFLFLFIIPPSCHIAFRRYLNAVHTDFFVALINRNRYAVAVGYGSYPITQDLMIHNGCPAHRCQSLIHLVIN